MIKIKQNKIENFDELKQAIEHNNTMLNLSSNISIKNQALQFVKKWFPKTKGQHIIYLPHGLLEIEIQ
jgi:hypothetical protein